MSIAQRFGLLICFAALGLGGLAGFSIHQMKYIFNVSSFANMNSLPSVLVLDNAYNKAVSIEGLLWQHLAVTDNTKMAEIELQLNQSTATLMDALEEYEKKGLIVNDQDRALLQADYAVLSTLDTLRTNVVNLSKAKKKSDALILMQNGQSTFSKLNDAFQAHRVLNYDLGRHSANEAESTLQYTTRVHMAITGLIIVFMALVGLILLTSLPRQQED
jgi:methyl-accepting chemotaxis protein